MVSQQSAPVVVKDFNILHYLNLEIKLPTISFPLYDIHPTWLPLTNNLKFDYQGY